jgi:hypothetical protein
MEIRAWNDRAFSIQTELSETYLVSFHAWERAKGPPVAGVVGGGGGGYQVQGLSSNQSGPGKIDQEASRKYSMTFAVLLQTC